MYAQVRCIEAKRCLVLPEGTTPAQGASCFVNPLTVLGMIETLRLDGHTALVHTAAASNLGQILNRILHPGGHRTREHRAQSRARRPAPGPGRFLRVQLQRGALPRAVARRADRHGRNPGIRRHRWRQTCQSDLDGDGGGRHGLGHRVQPLRVDDAQTGLHLWWPRSQPHRADPATSAWPGASADGCCHSSCKRSVRRRHRNWRERVAAEIKTTFASVYTREVSLAEALQLDAISIYGKQATGEKFLIIPNKDQ